MSIAQLQAIPATQKDNNIRREFGRQHMSAVMIWWLDQNDWSHPAFEKLATWALDEDGALHSSQVSHIRNNKMRMMGVKSLDAFGAINLAVWAYNNLPRSEFNDLGCRTVTAEIESLIKGKLTILDPEDGLPLDQGKWMNLYLGYLKIEEAAGLAKPTTELTDVVAMSVVRYLVKEVNKTGKPMSEITPVMRKVMSEEQTRKIMEAFVGIGALAGDDLPEMLEPLTKALKTISGRELSVDALLTEANT